jgi:uncharacterized protein YjbJ (UPF0337 family)
MNWDQIQGSWKEYAGRARTKWGEITDDEFEQAAGRKDEMVGLIQKRYGYEKERAERELDEWTNSL